jgi:hypothetical protein
MRLSIAPPAVALAVLTAGAIVRAGEDTEHYVIRAELGAEYDSNAHRTENLPGDNIAPVASPLGRGVLTATLSDAVDARQDVAMSATAAGKLFTEAAARDEDVAIAQSSLTWRVVLSPRATLSAAGAYYEAFQRGSPPITYTSSQRDFRSLGSTLRLGWALGRGAELAATAGYRTFVFKPDRNLDFDAPSAGVELHLSRESPDGEAEWEGLVGAGYERRAYAGTVFINPCQPPSTLGHGCQLAVGDELRVDQPLSARVELARTGRVLVGAGYALQYISSNSLEFTMLRQFLTARFAAALPGDLFFTARAELLFAHYRDPLLLQASIVNQSTTTIEDESHSSVHADLSWALGERLQLIARYTYYGRALSDSSVSYTRQTAMLAVAFTMEK